MADEKLRFGIIGAAGRGNSFVRSLEANPATRIAALCDIREEQVRQHAAELGVTEVFTDAQAMLDSGSVDAVVIGTPMQFHAPQAIMALERDIHVLCEVTAGVSVEECCQLVRAARRSRHYWGICRNPFRRKPHTPRSCWNCRRARRPWRPARWMITLRSVLQRTPGVCSSIRSFPQRSLRTTFATGRMP